MDELSILTDLTPIVGIVLLFTLFAWRVFQELVQVWRETAEIFRVAAFSVQKVLHHLETQNAEILAILRKFNQMIKES